MKTRSVRILVLVYVLVGMGGRAAAQSQPTFRTGVDLVQLDVIVLDKNRRPVTGLTAADFTIEEDGKPKAIEAFVPVTLPGPARAEGVEWTRTVPPDVVSNQLPGEGRLVVLLMDRSIPQGPAVEVARTIAKSAVDALGVNDLAAVVGSSGFANEGEAHNFTRDRSKLIAAIDAPFMGLVAPPSMGPRGLQSAPPEMLRSGDCMCGLCTLETLDRIASSLSNSRRQKTLIVIGSNIVIQGKPQEAECQLHIKTARERAFQALDRANVTVHAIDPSGLETLAKGADAFSGDLRPSVEGMLERQGNLAVFPDYTGGRTVLNTNGPEDLIPAIFAETESYYLIGIARDAGVRPDEARQLRVRVNREDVTVRSRTAYYGAAAATASPAATQADPALGALLPDAGVPMALGLTPRFAADGTPRLNAVIALGEVGAEALGVRPPAGPWDLTLALFDKRAKPMGQMKQSIAAPGGTGSTHEFQIDLPVDPGSYEARFALLAQASGRTGSVFGYIDVPAAESQVALSGIVIAAPLATAPGQSALGVINVAPTLRRTFTAGDDVTAFVQVKQKASQPASIVVRTRIEDAAGHVAVEGERIVAPSAFSASGVADIQAPLSVASLKPGRYLLTIEATLGDVSDRRQLPFVVR